MTQAIKRGIGFYNFLGIMGIFDGSDGVLRFKQNSLMVISFVRWELSVIIHNLQKYKAIQGVKKPLGRN